MAMYLMRMLINQVGSSGIGTSNPQAGLHITAVGTDDYNISNSTGNA